MRKLPVLVSLGAALILLLQATRFGNSWTDDAYISFRYARQFWSGQGMAFNPGERLEGLTNLGWALILSPWSEHDILSAAQALGLGCGLLVIGLLTRFALTIPGLRVEALVAGLAVLVVPVWVPYWAVQGLETPGAMLAVTLAWSCYASNTRSFATSTAMIWPMAAIGLAIGPWLRPDGALLAVLLGAWHLVRRAEPGERLNRGVLLSVGVVLVSALILVGLKLSWFGEIFPNTFHLKVGGWPPERGLRYFQSFLQVPSPALPIVILLSVGRAAVWAVRRDDRALPGLVFGAASAAVVVQNGDFMANFRLLVPWWPAAAAAVMLAVQDLLERWGHSQERRLGVLAGLGLCLAAPASATILDQLDQRRDNYQNPVFSALLDFGYGPLLAQGPFPAAWAIVNAGEQESVACTELGLISFVHDGPVLDLLGLTDRVMAGRNGESRGQKWASVQERATWVVVHTGAGVWGDYGPYLVESGWKAVDGCGENWVFQNPRSLGKTSPPSPEIRERRLQHVLARAPRHDALLDAVARALAAAGAPQTTLTTFLDAASQRSSGTISRCDPSRPDCGLAEACEASTPRVPAATLADVSRWPSRGEQDVPVDLNPGKTACIPLRNEAAAAWDQAREAWAGTGSEGRDQPRKLARAASVAMRGWEPGAEAAAKAAWAAAETAAGAAPAAQSALAASKAAWERSVVALGCEGG